MKVLMVTNKVKTYALGFQNIIIPLIELGHQIIWAADFSAFLGNKAEIPCKTKQISIRTNPINPCNVKAYIQLIKIIEEEKIEAVICSTPIGGALARLAANKRKISPVLYAAHGFLFFKGAPLVNRTVYKWEEKILARMTDVLITITQEDFEAAQNFKMRSGKKPYLVHGAGVCVGVKVCIDKTQKRTELSLPQNAVAIVSAGELNANKNVKVVIQAIAKLKNPNIHFVVCGTGKKYKYLVNLAKKLSVSNQILFLGYRTDLSEILKCADIFVMPSFREGVPRALLEAMDLGLPCVGSRTRGISDLIEDGHGGFVCNPRSADDFADALNQLSTSQALRCEMGAYNQQKSKEYSKEIVREELKKIFKEVL